MYVSMKIRYLLLIIPGVLLAVTLQAAEIPLRGPVPFEAFDKDGNKMISPQEFVETHNLRKKMRADANMPPSRMPNEPAFTYFDSNADNQISAEELNAARNAMQQQRGGMRQGMPPQGRAGGMDQGQGQGMNRGRQMPGFADFDLNGDGVLVANEFYEARAKRMSQRAEQGYPMRNSANAPPFEALDSNRDGKVTADEFSAHQATHMQMRGR